MQNLSNIARHLTHMANLRPYQEAVIMPVMGSRSTSPGSTAYKHLTYKQLDDLSENLAKQLLNHGLTAGMRTAFMVKPSLEFFVMTFALFKARIIPVLIDPGIGLKNMKRCLREAEAEAFIGIPAAHAARFILRWRGKDRSWKKLVSVGSRTFPGTISYSSLNQSAPKEQSLPESKIDDLAAILFTSGSTGAPKGAVYSHRNFLTQVELLKIALKISPGERDLCTFPLFALFAPALGMTAVIPQMDFTRPAKVDPEIIREALENFGISNMFGSPALIRRVAEYGTERGWQFPGLKRVISAGAPVPAAVIESFRKLMPSEGEFYTPYGATESLPVAIAESRLLLGISRRRHEEGHGLCVGTPVAPTSVKILKISDEIIPRWTEADLCPVGRIGEIMVSGDQVTSTYFNRESSTLQAKTWDEKGTLYHRMGDLGYIDEDGQLWFCGRKNHRVQTMKGELYTIPVEAVFNRHPKVNRTALVGLGTSPHQIPLLCVEPKASLTKGEEAELFSDLKALAKTHPQVQSIQSFLIHKDFPVDIRHNSKIFREKLKVWADKEWPKHS
ncbi:MAG: fatty acid CoA ligase family protein [Bdellovibrionota bacterium]|nr:MAG: peptide synthase [Pseudomonadota bacterium]